MPTSIVTAAAQEPVTLAEAKKQCNIETAFTDDDTKLTSYITTSRHRAEHITGRQLVTATYDLILPGFGACDAVIEIPYPPLVSVTSVKYYDETNTQQTLSTAEYSVDTVSDIGNIYPAYGYYWPTTYTRHDAVTIRFVCGYPVASGTATTPESIRQWILMDIATQYMQREGITIGSPVHRVPADYVDGLLDHYIVRKRFA